MLVEGCHILLVPGIISAGSKFCFNSIDDVLIDRYRGKRMRIDYFLLSRKLLDRLVSSDIHGQGIEQEGMFAQSHNQAALEHSSLVSFEFLFLLVRGLCRNLLVDELFFLLSVFRLYVSNSEAFL